jgi:hypothetical protein
MDGRIILKFISEDKDMMLGLDSSGSGQVTAMGGFSFFMTLFY